MKQHGIFRPEQKACDAILNGDDATIPIFLYVDEENFPSKIGLKHYSSATAPIALKMPKAVF